MIEGPALLELCADFSSSVLECLLQFLKDINLFDSPEFRTQLAMLVRYYKVIMQFLKFFAFFFILTEYIGKRHEIRVLQLIKRDY